MEPLGLVLIASLCSVLVAVSGWLVSSNNREIGRLTAIVHELTNKIAMLDGRYMANHEWMTRIQIQMEDQRKEQMIIERTARRRNMDGGDSA